MTNNLVLIVFDAGVIALWAMVIWGGWAEKAYVKTKNSEFTWYWLTMFGVEKSQDNCVRFIKSVSAFGIVLLAVATLLLMRFGK